MIVGELEVQRREKMRGKRGGEVRAGRARDETGSGRKERTGGTTKGKSKEEK